MRQYKDEVVKMNQSANHRPKSTLILGSQLENQRIQSLEQENRELSISLAEHQSALELIMNKYREQVLVMIKANGTNLALSPSFSQPSEKERQLNEQIAEMAYVMRQSASIDENHAAKEIETIRSLQVENDNLRQLLQISGQSLTQNSNESPLKDAAVSSQSSLATQPPAPTFSQTKLSLIEEVDNKDSGIYEEEYSPNFDLFKKGKKRKPLNTSKHVDNLENLFRMPPSLNKPSLETENDIHENNFDKNSTKEKLVLKLVEDDNETGRNLDKKLDDVDQTDHQEEKQHQMYTVEALVENNTFDKDDDDLQLTNGHLEEDLLIDDLNAILEQEFDTADSNSEPSDIHESNLNNDFKDVLLNNSLPNKTDSSKNETHLEENEALKFLDDALDFSEENSDSDNEDNNRETFVNNESLKENDTPEVDNEENLSKSTSENHSTSLKEKETEAPNEMDVLDFLDNFDKEIEEDDCSETQSEAESEVTIIDTKEEDDIMALFDSVLEDDESPLSGEEGND